VALLFCASAGKVAISVVLNLFRPGRTAGLPGCRFVLALELDGWHVDYQLKSATAVGGGPHYVIDAASGAIAKKRYEQ
jgi:hypothetical protein